MPLELADGSPGPGFPEVNRPVEVDSRQQCPIWREGYRPPRALIRGYRELTDFLARGHIPKAQRLPAARGDEVAPVGRKHHGLDGRLMAYEAADFLAGGDIPETDGAVVVSGSYRFPVGCKRDRCDRGPLGIAEPDEFLSGGKFPDASGPITAC
jgi:hypothetical protein